MTTSTKRPDVGELLRERLAQLEDGGCKKLTIAQVVGLIGFCEFEATPTNESPAPQARSLDDRQRVVIEWGERCFGADHMTDKIVRAARFFEEAAELVQAVGLPKDHAQRAFDHVYSRPAGEPAQEVGGTANTLMALCGAIGLSLDACQIAEIERVLAKDPSHFAARNQAKLQEVDAVGPAPQPPVEGLREADVMKIITKNFGGKMWESLTRKDWKDGIDITRPSYAVMHFARDLAALASPSLTAGAVAWRWRSIFNENSWCVAVDKPTIESDQYITEPLFALDAPATLIEQLGKK